MTDLFWFLAGALAGVLAAAVLMLLRRPPPPAVAARAALALANREVPGGNRPTTTPGSAAGATSSSARSEAEPTTAGPVATAGEPHPQPAARTTAHPCSIDAELDAAGLAAAVAGEIASLASGIEGRAHALVQASHDPTAVPHAAEGMCAALLRLRRLHGKLVAYGSPLPPAPADPTELAPVLAAVCDELRLADLGLTFAFRMPPVVPRIAATRSVLQDALLFTGLALRQLEQGALRLSITAEPGIEEDDTQHPRLQLEFHLEWDTGADAVARAPAPPVQFLVLRRAAERLLATIAGSVHFEHDPGHAACAMVELPALEPAPASEQPPALPDPAPLPATSTDDALATADAPPRHRFGGVLVLESDPAVRAMLAVELKAAGRAIFACADSAAARSLLEATPERFELLIVDQDNRLLDAELATTAVDLCPGLKVCVLASPMPGDAGGPPGLLRIEKPFGPPELRSALATVLGS